MEDTFDRMCNAFQARVDELTSITRLRLEDSSLDTFSAELKDTESTVSQLELKLEGIKHFLAQEREGMPKLQEVLRAAEAHHKELAFVAENLPQYLPGPSSRPSGPVTRSAAAASCELPQDDEQDENASLAANSQHPAEAADRRKKRQTAPRRYITQQELASLSSYMTARLSLDKVNAALDDAASMAEDLARQLSAARSKGRLTAAERKRTQSLMVSVAAREGVKGRFWFMEADMRQTQTLRPDKTGKALLTVLRHLGRLHEVRVQVDGAMQPVYVLQQ
ncbi:hypothetical protein CVIRNUC_003222 [Coccomyxa viridis]|uniref:Spindle and kinetochore-associated protein 1 n=1 Tax=Coccomyxa viridis TaxID=1274662 RepID=A0AAV1HZ46_9CHLO|nr:hypothetical protein CVIRNUC_003222 [Coccomyxa viridis]